jgi:hypothetical protein
VIHAAIIALSTITSVAALAVVLFGSAAALERWLDSSVPSANPTRAQLSTVGRKALVPSFDPDAHPRSA